ncbi:hypothetical protein THOB06_210067 [Vibrio rotiferianus]|nr:hypothetical protein THOG10_210064 [Vibrio rotiferianus]CAH1575756.1 hypothetical protein THOB06_210067 [Vibrio rotiferianus]
MRIKSQRQHFKKFPKKYIFFSQNQLSSLSVCFRFDPRHLANNRLRSQI